MLSAKRILLAGLLPVAAVLAGCGSHARQPAGHATSRPAAICHGYVTPYGCQAHNPAVFRAAAKPTAPAAGLTGSPVITMFDSTDPWPGGPIPSWAPAAAGYVDGSWPTWFSFRGHYPHVVGISVSSGVGADCFDMEPGNPGPDSAGPWAHWQFSQGNTRPCEYTMLSWIPAVRQSLAQWGIPVCSSSTQNFCVREWDANWTYSPHIDAGAMCTQWTNHGPSGENYDESMCLPSFFGQPKPPADPQHYAWFPTSPTVAGGLTERQTVLLYDGARQHAAKYHGWLLALEGWLRTDASRVAWLAAHVWGTPNHPGWSSNHGGWRYQEDTHRADGRVCAAKNDPCAAAG